MSIRIQGNEKSETPSSKKPNQPTPEQESHATSVTVTEHGPYIVAGSVPLAEEIITPVGGHKEYRERRTFAVGKTYALCRCGHTSTPPFCDGAHAAFHFDGTETASRMLYKNRADVYPGEGVYLFDDNRCAFARFCHREDGDVWTLTEHSGNPHLKKEAIKASSDCPTGRLVHVDTESGRMYEPDYDQGIWVLQDPEREVSGPLFVHGGVPLISEDGTEYERRNRYALCRCGASRNKPFCDALHVTIGFVDGI